MRGAWFWLALAGCPNPVEPGPGTIDTGYYSYWSYYYGYYSTSFLNGPVTITRVSADCFADQVVVSVETAGWTAEGTAFVQETSAPDEQWAEEHPLYSFEFAPDGSWDRLRVELATGVVPHEVVPGQSTAFTCDGVVGGDLTWLIAVTDIYGELADCVAFGHDPEGLLDGAYDGVSEPSFSTIGCSVQTTTAF